MACGLHGRRIEALQEAFGLGPGLLGGAASERLLAAGREIPDPPLSTGPGSTRHLRSVD
jgi:hypothetical protein